MTKREALIKKISTYKFSEHELQLYLDTHPEDSSALNQANRYRELAKPLVEQFEKQYGSLTKKDDNGNNWDWIKGPWPWESEGDK